MLLEVQINDRGQITVPSALRKALNIQNNSKLIIQKIQNNLVIRPYVQNKKRRTINELAFSLGKINKGSKDIDELIRDVKHKKALGYYGK